MDVEWLGRIGYREAWDRQHELAADRAAGRIGDRLLLLEHPPVVTLGRHADERHVLATPEWLDSMGIDVIRVERGGEATYHGPGQLVAYPILRLRERGLFVRPLVRALEAAMIETAAAYGVRAGRRDGFPGVWCEPDGPRHRKLGALGLRIERDVTYHGIALNVTTDLSGFGLIDPCGMPGIGVTSIAVEAGWPPDRAQPGTESVRDAGERFADAFVRAIDAARTGDDGVAAGGAAPMGADAHRHPR